MKIKKQSEDNPNQKFEFDKIMSYYKVFKNKENHIYKNDYMSKMFKLLHKKDKYHFEKRKVLDKIKFSKNQEVEQRNSMVENINMKRELKNQHSYKESQVFSATTKPTDNQRLTDEKFYENFDYYETHDNLYTYRETQTRSEKEIHEMSENYSPIKKYKHEEDMDNTENLQNIANLENELEMNNYMSSMANVTNFTNFNCLKTDRNIEPYDVELPDKSEKKDLMFKNSFDSEFSIEGNKLDDSFKTKLLNKLYQENNFFIPPQRVDKMTKLRELNKSKIKSKLNTSRKKEDDNKDNRDTKDTRISFDQKNLSNLKLPITGYNLKIPLHFQTNSLSFNKTTPNLNLKKKFIGAP
jgi:hypothetical protein